ncbi:MAG: glycosyltransferase family 4 protein [Anaerolineae bacterium]|nr:glycosyltransferase family 4 protein [Anaerolineae bacterium]
MKKRRNIGFVSTRFAGTDGVSLETMKWRRVFERRGYHCYFFAGEVEYPEDISYEVPEAHFMHPDIRAMEVALFDTERRAPDISMQVHKLKEHLKLHLYRYCQKFDIDFLVVENALSLPMNIPLGLAITELIAETGVPTIAHHHDFAWERPRFAVTAADDYLRAAFPPTLRAIQHVVINSFAAQQLALRAGVAATLIPNVMDFDAAPAPLDDYAADLRPTLGIAGDDFLLLQPTRIVPRKQIEHAIDLTARLGERAVLVISHAAGDEGMAYEQFLREYTAARGARVIFAGDQINHVRRLRDDGRKVYALGDVYQQANLVTYPSRIEGFGNAFLETIYYRRPIVINNYEIFKTDIQPKGFRVIGFNDYISPDTVRQARDVLENPEQAEAMVEHNFRLGKRYYSYQALEEHLSSFLSTFLRNGT